jgi:hypothetical protein
MEGDRLDRTEKLFSIASSLVTLCGAAIAVAFWLASSNPGGGPHQQPAHPLPSSEQTSEAPVAAPTIQKDPPLWRRVQIVLLITSLTFFAATVIDVKTGGGIDRLFNRHVVAAIPLGAIVLITYGGVPLFLLREVYLWFSGVHHTAAYSARTLILVAAPAAGLIAIVFSTKSGKKRKASRTRLEAGRRV